MVTMRAWIDDIVVQFLDTAPDTVEHDLPEEAVDVDLDVLREHDVSVEQVRTATEWLRQRREEYLDRWEKAESEYERARDRAKQAEGPKRNELFIEAEEKREDAEDRRRQWEQVSARFQLFRRIERRVDNEIEEQRFQQETDAIMEDMDDVMQSLAEDLQNRRRADKEVATSVEQHLEEMGETAYQTPDTSRVREEIAEEELAETELGVGTGYGEEIAEDENDEEEFRVDASGDTV